jgi:hypothetical protein
LTFDDEPTRVLERSWSGHGGQDKLVLVMDLVTPRHGKVGRVSLVHNSRNRLLADSSLLQGEFRISLSCALEHCIVNTSANVEQSNSAMAHHA